MAQTIEVEKHYSEITLPLKHNGRSIVQVEITGTKYVSAGDADNMLKQCEDATQVSLDGVSGYYTSVTATSSWNTSGLWEVSYRFLGFNPMPPEEEKPSEDDPFKQSFELHYEWSRGGAGVCSVIIPGKTDWTAGYIKTVQLNGQTVFRGTVSTTFNYKQTGYYLDSSGTMREKELDWSKTIIVDAMDLVAKSWIPRPLYFPGIESRIADGTDHTMSISAACSAAFSACDLPSPDGLPGVDYFHSGRDGSDTYVLGADGPASLSRFVAMISQATGMFLFADPNFNYHFVPMSASSGASGPYGASFGRGSDASNMIGKVVVWGKNGKRVEAGWKAPIACYADLAIDDFGTLQAIADYIYEKAGKAISLQAKRGSLRDVGFPQPSAGALSIAVHVSYQMPPANLGAQPINVFARADRKTIIDEAEVLYE